jgi:hypothetical protein
VTNKATTNIRINLQCKIPIWLQTFKIPALKFILKKTYSLEALNALNHWKVSLCEVLKQPASYDERRSLAELRIICTIAEQWVEAKSSAIRSHP